MAFLKLSNIGKIYVSENNVSVGIRGVSLSFEKGEFVAVTGKSGSGKSTLLNVISGIDTYEEGEMYIEGQPTSHYMQSDFEAYREKYVSFIFQDYNIIESFTVLENVELSLMHIEDRRERRRRALELISRVGMTSHIKHKGSKLSGGQKQRTVIARALAKDSPIILADEPTGNLDSKTSKEIIELLREVSRDKLLIVVTHNFEQIEAYATRHIRIFDGAVESDRTISETTPVSASESCGSDGKRKDKGMLSDVRKGITLGGAIFRSKPRLSTFLCLLMIIGMLGVFVCTSLLYDAADIFQKHMMFRHIDGRVVITRQDGRPISEDELKSISDTLSAESTLHYDILLDDSRNTVAIYKTDDGLGTLDIQSTYDKDFGEPDIGRYPAKNDEVLLYLPLSAQKHFGVDTILCTEMFYTERLIRVVGIKYYYDNNKKAQALFTRDGFELSTASHYLVSGSNTSVYVDIVSDDLINRLYFRGFMVSSEVSEGKICINEPEYLAYLKTLEGKEYKVSITVNSDYYIYNYNYGSGETSIKYSRTFEDGCIEEKNITSPAKEYYRDYNIFVSEELFLEMANEMLGSSYRQASLFFENDKRAESAAAELKDMGYIAVPSYTTYTSPAGEIILGMISSVMKIFMWFMSILFLSFFISLCSSRALLGFRGDMAIMRSMGIPVKVIKVGMYTRMLISLLPAFVFIAFAAVYVFTSPTLSGYFTYLYPWQYMAMAVGMILLTAFVTRRHIGKLFGDSVKKSLKKGASE